jgi:hypothetical protein
VTSLVDLETFEDLPANSLAPLLSKCIIGEKENPKSHTRFCVEHYLTMSSVHKKDVLNILVNIYGISSSSLKDLATAISSYINNHSGEANILYPQLVLYDRVASILKTLSSASSIPKTSYLMTVSNFSQLVAKKLIHKILQEIYHQEVEDKDYIEAFVRYSSEKPVYFAENEKIQEFYIGLVVQLHGMLLDRCISPHTQDKLLARLLYEHLMMIRRLFVYVATRILKMTSFNPSLESVALMMRFTQKVEEREDLETRDPAIDIFIPRGQFHIARITLIYGYADRIKKTLQSTDYASLYQAADAQGLATQHHVT